MLKTSNTTTTVETSYTVNGKTYKSMSEMDPATRKILEDANQKMASAFNQTQILPQEINEPSTPTPPSPTPEITLPKKYLWIMLALLVIIFLISFAKSLLL